MSTSAIRQRLYARYASTHAGFDADASLPTLNRDVIARLPADRSRLIVDVGCGQGQLVRACQRAGYKNVVGIDISPEQVQIAHGRGISEVVQADSTSYLADREGGLGAILATDFLEHLTLKELLEFFSSAYGALQPGGTLIARVPNAVSPFGGNYRHGDVTHESWFTAQSVRQLGSQVEFDRIDVFPCRPVVHGLISTMRYIMWMIFDCFMRLALAAETGVLRGTFVTQNIVFVASKRG